MAAAGEDLCFGYFEIFKRIDNYCFCGSNYDKISLEIMEVAVAASFEALAAADADGSETAIVGNVEKEMPNPANQEIA